MRNSALFWIGAPLFLAACATTTASESTPEGFIAELPEAVKELAAPYQDLSAVRLDERGCYVYRHVGVVETTFLPLRTREGRPICTRAPDAATG